VWEVAALMKDVAPDMLSDIVINEQGDTLDLTVEERLIMSAIAVGEIESCQAGKAVPNSLTEVTLRSLIPWLRKRAYVELANDLQSANEGVADINITSQGASADERSATTVTPISRSAAQDAEIMDKLTQLDFDPLHLPKNQPGKAGAKAEIKRALGTKGMWSGNTVFDKAWDRLRRDEKIIDAT